MCNGRAPRGVIALNESHLFGESAKAPQSGGGTKAGIYLFGVWR